MPYLGNEAADRFVSQPAVDQFSGDGSTTAFTLSFPVTSDQDILVSVDGVVQDVAAYAVSSGTTLTFTAAPSSNSGNNIFVNYLARTHATVAHPATSALTATTGTFTGAFTSPGIDDNADATAITIDSSERVGIDFTPKTMHANVTSSLNVGSGTVFQRTKDTYLASNTYYNSSDTGTSISTGYGLAYYQDVTNGAHKWFTSAASAGSADATHSFTIPMTIDSSGHVTTPNQPAFHAYPNGNIAVSNSTSLSTFAANAELYDVGSNFNLSTYKFTAPVTGRYLIKWGFRLDSSDAGATYYYYRIYTSNRTYDQIVDITSDEAYSAPNNIAIVDMDANDEAYLQYQQYSGTNNHATIVSNSALTYIQGILLG